MAMIEDLPNETILQILTVTEPQDIESVANVCKRWHLLSAEILKEHRHLKKKYGRVDDKDPLTIPQLLGRDNAHILWYVRRLTFHCDRVNYHSWHRFPQRSLPTLKHANYFSGDRLARVREVYDSVPIPGEGYRTWMRMIQEGHDGPLKVLLMVCCPNLATVVFTHRYLEGMRQMSFYLPPYSFDVIMDTLFGCPKPLLDELLPSLRRVFVNCDGDGGFGHPLYENINVSQRFIRGFLSLPHISELQAANCVNLAESGPAKQNLTAKSSPVEKLDLGTMYFTPDSLEDVLSSINALRCFSTQDATDNAGEILLRYHRNTLEALYIGKRSGGRGHAHFGFGSLPHFPLLKSISLDVSHLYRWGARPDQSCFVDLSALLPKSLETLQVFGSQSAASLDNKGTSQELIDFLTMFMKTKSDTHPELRGICLSRLDLPEAISQNPMPDLKGLETVCQENQVLLTTGNITTSGPCPYPPRQKDVGYVCKVCTTRVYKFGTNDRSNLSQCYG